MLQSNLQEKVVKCQGNCYRHSILHLNDPSEFGYGVDLMTRHLLGRKQSESPVVQMMIQRMLDRIYSLMSRLSFFVASFSLRGDDLGQWRAYGANGRGYALGIAPQLFRHKKGGGPSATPPTETIFVSSVTYEQEAAIRRQQNAVDKAVEIVDRCRVNGELNCDDDVLYPFLQQMALKLFVPLIWNSITTKHPAYENEQEKRLILINDPGELGPYIKTRVRGSDVVPYIPNSMPLRAPGSIVGITVGPAANYETAKHGVESLLQSLGIDPGNLVTQSDIPYRG